jgi:hypothetical protein
MSFGEFAAALDGTTASVIVPARKIAEAVNDLKDENRALSREVAAAMSANEIRGLKGVLKNAVAMITKEARALAGEIEAEAGEFKNTISAGHALKEDIKQAHAEFKAELGLDTNGAPGDVPATPPLGQSPASQAS